MPFMWEGSALLAAAMMLIVEKQRYKRSWSCQVRYIKEMSRQLSFSYKAVYDGREMMAPKSIRYLTQAIGLVNVSG